MLWLYTPPYSRFVASSFPQTLLLKICFVVAVYDLCLYFTSKVEVGSSPLTPSAPIDMDEWDRFMALQMQPQSKGTVTRKLFLAL